jgi:hypothetical protein
MPLQTNRPFLRVLKLPVNLLAQTVKIGIDYLNSVDLPLNSLIRAFRKRTVMFRLR